ncbi:DUF1684 domain-containing protein [Winogradskyella jejuensis]|uniref:DUF1684 domain-containing protein n=1 Tax=Winogradskyella jejuensis TaxID=1089305 RepID=A0A1M5S4X0_9FLAO|nr:DUF1684 domain-containing protein [Winogradskyella jejuensis]SHH33672.1 hypothetical protein SAMN05444148_1775 [Winogradskyella jejuensis]
MRYILLVLAFVSFTGCAQKKPATIGDTPWQVKMNSDFKDASKSPLKAKDLKTFEGLDFFPFDSSYVVKASLKRTPDSEWFNMKTTTSRLSKERVYGIATFILKGKEYKLNIYQGEENMNSEKYKDYLFLPFLDNTNGETTYAGGRYIGLSIPKGDSITIDFNEAYNPYCAYNEKYSCPIVPRANYLNTRVEAGVKAFKK